MVLLETENQLERRAGEELLGKNVCTHRELCADVKHIVNIQLIQLTWWMLKGKKEDVPLHCS